MDPLSVLQWVKDVAEDLLAVGGRLPRTLRALLVPGLLTREWLEGRQRRYVHPLRLFLASGLLLFALPRLLPGKPYDDLALEQVTLEEVASTAWGAGIDQTVTEVGPTVLIVLTPLFALVLKILYLRSGRLYPEHLVFALNLHSVAFILLLPLVPLLRWDEQIPDWVEYPLGVLLVAGIAVHLYGSLRRVYGSSVAGALLRSPALLGGQIFAVGLGLIIGADLAWDDPRDAAREADALHRQVAAAREAADSGRLREILPRAVLLHQRLELHMLDAHRQLHLADLLMEAARLEPQGAAANRQTAYRLALECLVREPARPLCLGMAAEAADALGMAAEAAGLRRRLRAADTGEDDPWGHRTLLEEYRRNAGRGEGSG